jgi:hypothetical protein
MEPPSITGSQGVGAVSEALVMTIPTEDEVLAKAKQLAHDDGKLWLWKTEEVERKLPSDRGCSIDDTLRAEYLVRARLLLTHGEVSSRMHL